MSPLIDRLNELDYRLGLQRRPGTVPTEAAPLSPARVKFLRVFFGIEAVAVLVVIVTGIFPTPVCSWYLFGTLFAMGPARRRQVFGRERDVPPDASRLGGEGGDRGRLITDDASMASSLSDGWEIEASRVARRRMAFGLPVMLAVMVLAYVAVSVAGGERVAFGGLFGFGFVLLIFGAVSAAIWYLCRPGIGSAFLSPIAVLPRADRKAALARIRTGEPGETPEEAQLLLTVAERTRSQWWSGLVCLLIGLQNLRDAITGDGWGGRWSSAPWVLMCLALAAWSEVNRRRALRAIDANRRRWGAI